MFIINPDPYSLPSYRIGPFRTRDIALNRALPIDNLIDEYFVDRFGHKNFVYTENGRQAINLALKFFKLQKDDVVTILTTTGNFYISSCVTYEIERFCKWSRIITAQTKLLFVNHEFGYPFSNLQSLKAYGLPIIEDCAGSFFSNDSNSNTGRVGDFVIYSFPKMFPIQIGGLLVANFEGRLNNNIEILIDRVQYIKNVLSYYIESQGKIVRNRLFNYSFLKARFEALGFDVRFNSEADSIPGVFMFRTDNKNINLPMLKEYFYKHGIQCSVFYGEESFFIPVHQALEESDMLYFSAVMESFISKELHD